MNKSVHHPSELILNEDGSIYHLAIRKEHIADNVIIVGDQNRVQKVSQYFDRIDFEIQNREFKTHTGEYRGKRISVMSTGIGTDNIDIFMNELDATVNMNFDTKIPNPVRKSLNIIRVGTTGALHANISVGAHIISHYGLGLDGLLHYYNYKNTSNEALILDHLINHLQWHPDLSKPYLVKGSDRLNNLMGHNMISGITATALGFYAPQGRELNLKSRHIESLNRMKTFHYNDLRITNFEMETSALFGLGALMGHECCTCCVVLANRSSGEFTRNHHGIVDHLIRTVLERIIEL